MNRPTPTEVGDALQRLTRVEGILGVALMAIDKKVTSGEDWQISESLHGAFKLMNGCYATLVQAISEEPEYAHVASSTAKSADRPAPPKYDIIAGGALVPISIAHDEAETMQTMAVGLQRQASATIMIVERFLESDDHADQDIDDVATCLAGTRVLMQLSEAFDQDAKRLIQSKPEPAAT